MDVYKTILRRRSIRRFRQKEISLVILKKLVNAARLAPSAGNLQPLEFFVVKNKELRTKVFETIGWAKYIKPEWKPNEDERPTAYIVIITKEHKSNPWYVRDASIAAENIILAAEGKGIGSCLICNIDRERLRKILSLPENYIIDSLIALGYKKEHPVIVDIKNNDIKYWRDEKEILHVPKRKIKDIIHIDRF